MSMYFSDEEGVHKSPGLQPISVKAKPSPSPPPYLPPATHSVGKQGSIDSASKRQRSRRTQRPSQADQVLLSFMSPNNPEIANQAAVVALNSASQSEDESSTEERTSRRDNRPHDPGNHNATDLVIFAQRAIQSVAQVSSEPSDGQRVLMSEYRRPSDSRSPLSPELTTRPRNNSDMRALVDGVASVNTADDPTKPSAWFETSRTPRSPLEANDRRHSESMSSRIRSLSIPQSLSDPDTLPALRHRQSSTVGIQLLDNQPKSLPGFQELSDIADAARTKEGETSPQSYQAQRASISSSSNGGPGQSPTLGRHYSIGSQSQALSPASSYLPSISHHSPSSIQSEISPRDPFRTSISLSSLNRRQSQASDSPQAYGPLLSSSSDSFGPSAHTSPSDNPHRMSIDGVARPILPPPQPQSQHNTQNMHTMPIIGLPDFRCEHEGCTAPPFQTQYLLNSHANVHSQVRPHYCPVKDCPRAEGGKGFKRKNEMIRHGLVHDSPGYVCPFCPDKEHKYPRPDNLQRHVRAHHVDKDKDDPQLREVLAQRPEGGNRGRRRRVGERLEYR